jgi:hypothetical protein
MDAFRPELARKALRGGAQPSLGGGEGREPGASAQAGGRTGEQDRAAAARQHVARGFAAGHETRETGELPDTLEQRAGGFQRARLGVGAGVEQADLERADIALDGFE